jgi:hypothetical protein
MSLKLKAGCLLAFVAVLSGCQTPNINANHDFQGKVWRAEIYGNLSGYMRVVDDENPKENIAEFIKRTGFTAELMRGMRLAPVRFRSTSWGGTWHWLKAAIPDSMKNTDVQKGAIVDVLVERNLDYHYPSYRINRVVRIVCLAGDTACINNVKKEKSLNTVIDDNPVPGNHYGHTYARKLTQEEADVYLKWLKSQ